MAKPVTDVILCRPIILASASISSDVQIPRNCSVMTIMPPDSLSARYWKMQHLRPTINQDSDYWSDTYYNVNGELVQLRFPYSSQMAVVLRSGEFGSGIVRFNLDGDVQTEDAYWFVMFSGFNN